jgi:hypothetical protein
VHKSSLVAVVAVAAPDLLFKLQRLVMEETLGCQKCREFLPQHPQRQANPPVREQAVVAEL